MGQALPGSQTALVVDDHVAVRRALCDRIQTSFGHFLVREAGSVDAALRIVDEEDVDLVLMDVHLPGMDGIDGTRAVLQHSPRTAVVVVSIFDDQSHRSAATRAGASAYVCKRSIGTELIPTLQELIDSRRHRRGRGGYRATEPDKQRQIAAPKEARSAHGEQGRRVQSVRNLERAKRTVQPWRSAECNRAIVDAAVNAIVVIDEQCTIRRFNRGAERLFGYREAEMEGQNISVLVPRSLDDQRGGYLPELPEAGTAAGIGAGVEVVARRSDGAEFPLHIAFGELRLGGAQMYFCTMRDISDEKQAAARQGRRLADLEMANRGLESFGYSVSHELRAPLRVMDGYAQMIAENYAVKLDDEGRRLLGVIRHSSVKMRELIDDLIAFSRLGRKTIVAVECDMTALVHEVLDELPAAADGAKPQCEVETLPAARIDRALMRQVWINLLSNAFKFTAKREQPQVKVAASVVDTEIIYTVSDNGAGFDMRYYSKLFDAFQRLHRASDFPGTGLGLALVSLIVSRHGGRVWAESVMGEGATFHVALPHPVGGPPGAEKRAFS